MGEAGRLAILFAAGAGLIFWYWRRRPRRGFIPKPADPCYPEEMAREQLARNYAFLGDAAMARLRGADVVVVGCGGVGSHAANLLARSGIGKLRLIDFDLVTLSSLNRHAVATREDVGSFKTQVLEAFLRDLCPWVVVEEFREKFDATVAHRLLLGDSNRSPSFIVDCIDNIDSKVDLLVFAKEHSIPIVSSMGSGARCNPTQVQVADIFETAEDPLARRVRLRLRQRGIVGGVPAVFSTEKPEVSLLPIDEEAFKENPVSEMAVFDNFRIRILPVLGTLPTVFGATLAAYVINRLAGQMHEYAPAKNRASEYQRQCRDLIMRDARYFGSSQVLVDAEDIAFLFEEVWRGRSAYSQRKDRLGFVRFRPECLAAPSNLILLTVDELKLWVSKELTFSDDQKALIEEKLGYVARYYATWHK